MTIGASLFCIATGARSRPRPRGEHRRVAVRGKHLRNEGITLVTARVKSTIRKRFDETGLTRVIGAERAYPTVRAAVDACVEGQRLQPA